MSQNPVSWFEIYVQDMVRAKAFYEAVFGIPLARLEGDGLERWAFPMQLDRFGASGALVYFSCADCAVEEAKAARSGGRIQKGKSSIGQYGNISLVLDTEGNLIGLHSMQ
jgi:uncharacterized protein